jgi:hypothetical protein
MLCGLSRLDESKLEAIRSIEQKLGKTLLAYTCHDIDPEELGDDQIAQLTEAEKDLGVVLVAVKD